MKSLGVGNEGQSSELNSKEGAGHGHDASTGAVTTETVLGRPTTKSESTRAFNGSRENYEKMQVVQKLIFRTKLVSFMCNLVVCEVSAKKIDHIPVYWQHVSQYFLNTDMTAKT